MLCTNTAEDLQDGLPLGHDPGVATTVTVRPLITIPPPDGASIVAQVRPPSREASDLGEAERAPGLLPGQDDDARALSGQAE